MKTVRICFVLCFALPVARAAAVPDSPTQLAAERVANENARVAAKQGNVTLAEQLLTGVNRSQPNTSWWHVETAQRLIHLAHDMPHRATGSIVPAIVSRTLEHLTQAESLTPVTRQKAAIKALAGMVHENFRGDHAAALASYRVAAQLAPENQTATRAADRLQRITDNVAARSRK